MSKYRPLSGAPRTAKDRNDITRFLEAFAGDIRESRGIPAPVLEKERGPIVNRFDGLSEEQEQVRVIGWWAKNHEAYKLPEFALFHIANGGARDYVAAARLKRMGLRPGVPDLCLAVRRGNYAGLYVEMKRSDGGTMSLEQIDIIAFLSLQGYSVHTANGAAPAILIIEHYLSLDRDTRVA